MSAKVIQVIETNMQARGDGKDTPYRIITQYWSFDGLLLAEFDPCGRRASAEAGEVSDE